MLKERGRVVAVESDALWVETIQQSVCGSCVAEKGCGQRLLAKFGAQPNHLRVLAAEDEAASYRVGDSITIGIPETAVVKASMLVYMLPLIIAVFFAGSVHIVLHSDGLSIIAGIIGLIAGASLVRLYAFYQRNNSNFQPRVIQ